MLIIAVILLVIVGFYFISVYNTLQKLKTQIEASIQEIGNQLKRQANLIPNLQSAVKGYLKHEKEIFSMLTDARKSMNQAAKSGDLAQMSEAVEKIQSVVPKIQVAIEDNPELKADKTVTKFMDELTDTADKLSYARRSLIDLTQSYNQMLVTLPSSIIANMFGFEKEKGLIMPETGEYREVSASEAKDPEVKL